MKLTIERLDSDLKILVEEQGDVVHIHFDGVSDALRLVLPLASYVRFVDAVNAAADRRTGAGVRVGIKDLTTSED